MTDAATAPEISALTALLEELIGKPVDEVLIPHFDTLTIRMDNYHQGLIGHIDDSSEQLKKGLSLKIDSLKTTIGDLQTQLANQIGVLGTEQQAFRQEWQAALVAAATASAAKAEEDQRTARKLARRFGLLAPCAGLVGAGMVELFHRLI